MDPPSLVSRCPLPDFWQFPQSGEFRSGRRQRVLVPSTAASEEESSTSSANDLTACEVECLKVMKPRDENGNTKAEAEASPSINNRPTDENAKSLEVTKQDYIHVRARRGQATDSHSLAERARREKIGERMKILQDLVPGCSKIIGKASVLDEIINYIQSLQHQVEFLSMKLEAVNSRLNSDFERFHSRDTDDTASGLAYGSQAGREYEQGSEPDWLHMHVGDAFERVT